MKQPSYLIAGEQVRESWGRELVDHARSHRFLGGPGRLTRHTANGTTSAPIRAVRPEFPFHLFPFGSVSVANQVWVYPGYLIILGRGLYRVPATADYSAVTVTGNGWIILVARKIAPEENEIRFQTSAPNPASTDYELPICQVEFDGALARISGPRHVGNIIIGAAT